jgi:hypothetical protein
MSELLVQELQQLGCLHTIQWQLRPSQALNKPVDGL